MELMKLLIVGAKGMLGRQLSEVFKDFNPVCWDKEEVDITDEKQVREKITALRPIQQVQGKQAQGGLDVIINAAAYTDVDGAEVNREAAFAVNELGVKNLARVAKELGIKLVHYSTDYVFRGDKEDGYDEDDQPGPPVNVYGESKLAGERALGEIGPEFYLIRTAWLYGPSCAQATAGKRGGKNFVDTMLRLAKEKDSLSVVDDQWGSPTYAKDVALATRRIITGDYKPGVYHAVNGGVTTWCGWAREIFKLMGKGVEVKAITADQYPRPARRPRYSVLKDTKGLNMRPWPEALKDYLKIAAPLN